MKEVLIPQGSDQDFEIEILDTDGAAIDLSVGFSNIVAIVYNANKSVLDKFSIVTAAGWKEIDTTDQATGKLSFTLLTAVSNIATEGKKYLEVRVQKSDGTVGDGNYDTIVNDMYLFTITKSITVNLTLP
jgi:hypothetical protein